MGKSWLVGVFQGTWKDQLTNEKVQEHYFIAYDRYAGLCTEEFPKNEVKG